VATRRCEQDTTPFPIDCIRDPSLKRVRGQICVGGLGTPDTTSFYNTSSRFQGGASGAPPDEPEHESIFHPTGLGVSLMHPEIKYYPGDAMSTNRGPAGIRRACARLRSAETRTELAAALYREVAGYSLLDLQAMRGRMEKDLQAVPIAYRQRLYPRMMEMVFETHHALISTVRRGNPEVQDEPLTEEFRDFCGMVERTCLAADEEGQHLELLYFLLAAFTIFVLDRPAHPVGTPFPGGFEVEVRNGEYLCPVREKADDVENALCPYCPAKQSDV